MSRGTSNSNQRGSARDRRNRKRWLLETFDTDLGVDQARCTLCSTVLSYETMEVDRVVPGALGGRYTRDNIRPVCSDCNRYRGHVLQAELHRQRCRGQCWRCQVTSEYWAARVAQEMQREATTLGYETETAAYGRLITFREYLEARRGA